MSDVPDIFFRRATIFQIDLISPSYCEYLCVPDILDVSQYFKSI